MLYYTLKGLMDPYERKRLLSGTHFNGIEIPNGILTREFYDQYTALQTRMYDNEGRYQEQAVPFTNEEIEFNRQYQCYQPLIFRLINTGDVNLVRQYVELELPYHEDDLPWKDRALDYAGKNGLREIFAYLLSVTDFTKTIYELDSPFRYVYDDDEMYNMLVPYMPHFLFNNNNAGAGPFTFPFIFGDMNRVDSMLQVIDIDSIKSVNAWDGEQSYGAYIMKECIKYGRFDSICILRSLGIALPTLNNFDEWFPREKFIDFVSLLLDNDGHYHPAMFTYLAPDLQERITHDTRVLQAKGLPNELINDIIDKIFQRST